MIEDAPSQLTLPGLQGSWADTVVKQLKRGDSVSAMNAVLNKWMIDDTWRMEEDVLEDLLIDLGSDPTPGDVEAVSDEWIAGVRAGTWRPKTGEEREADWARGGDPRTDYSRRS